MGPSPSKRRYTQNAAANDNIEENTASVEVDQTSETSNSTMSEESEDAFETKPSIETLQAAMNKNEPVEEQALEEETWQAECCQTAETSNSTMSEDEQETKPSVETLQEAINTNPHVEEQALEEETWQAECCQTAETSNSTMSEDEQETKPSVETLQAAINNYLLVEEQTLEEETWQAECSTVQMRDEYILDNELYTDVVFNVGSASVQVKAHKVYLAKSSPVFSNMFYKIKSEQQIIHLPGVNVQLFRAMIRYIYSGTLDFSVYKYDFVCELLSLVKQYKLCDRLLCEIRNYLWENLLPANVWTAIEFAKNNDEHHLLDTAWKILQMNTDPALQHESFKNVSSSIIIEMLEKNYLVSSEIQLFKSCKSWAENVLRNEGLVVNADNLREKMLPFLPYIRFLQMEQDEFSIGPINSGVLNKDEIVSVFVGKAVPSNLPTELNISSINEPRDEPDFNSFTVCPRPETFAPGPPTGAILPLSASDAFTFPGLGINIRSQNTGILGIRILSQIKPEGADKNSYQENVSVFVIQEANRVILAKYNSIKKVRYGNYIDIIFDPIFYVPHNNCGVRFIVKFHKNGTYPIKFKSVLKDVIKRQNFGSYKKIGTLLPQGSTFMKNLFYKE